MAQETEPVDQEERSGSSLSSGSSDPETQREFIALSSQTKSSNGSTLNALLSSMGVVGSSDFTLPGDSVDNDGSYPKPIDESIAETEIISKVAEAEERVERWTIASPAMARNVEVQIRVPRATDGPAPMLYLLDGVSAPQRSGWVVTADIDEILVDENVTLVMPTEARGSLYADWASDDPILGRHQWETFLTKELPPLLENPTEGLNFNGKRAIGGLSMGATGALHIANANPQLFDATFGISGCYSPSSNAGAQSARLSVESRGGTYTNLYGAPGAPGYDFHDTAENPSGLRNQAVYLSSSGGGVDAEDADRFSTDAPQVLAIAIALEQGADTCTRALNSEMRKQGMTHQKVERRNYGVHNWRNFESQILPAWNHISPSLH